MGIVKYIIFLLVIAAPISYADADAGMNVGGGFGIHIEVIGNSTDTTDDSGDKDAEIYVHSYVTSADSKREDNYAFTGEELNFEVYAQSEEKADEVIIEAAGKETECKEKRSKLSNGEQLPDEFSSDAEYDKERMSYFECSFILDEGIQGEKDVKIRAFADDDLLKKETEEWDFNPLMSVEVFAGPTKMHIINNKGISLGIRQPSSKGIKLLEPQGDIILDSCDEPTFTVN